MYVSKVFAAWGGVERVWTDKMNALSIRSFYRTTLSIRFYLDENNWGYQLFPVRRPWRHPR